MSEVVSHFSEPGSQAWVSPPGAVDTGPSGVAVLSSVPGFYLLGQSHPPSHDSQTCLQTQLLSLGWWGVGGCEVTPSAEQMEQRAPGGRPADQRVL